MNLELVGDIQSFNRCARCRRDMVRHFFNGYSIVLHYGEESVDYPADYCLRIIHAYGPLKEYDGPVRRKAPAH